MRTGYARQQHEGEPSGSHSHAAERSPGKSALTKGEKNGVLFVLLRQEIRLLVRGMGAPAAPHLTPRPCMQLAPQSSQCTVFPADGRVPRPVFPVFPACRVPPSP